MQNFLRGDRLGKLIKNTQIREYFPQTGQEEIEEIRQRILANRKAEEAAVQEEGLI